MLQYDFSIKYIPGKFNSPTDGLFRIPPPDTNTKERITCDASPLAALFHGAAASLAANLIPTARSGKIAALMSEKVFDYHNTQRSDPDCDGFGI